MTCGDGVVQAGVRRGLRHSRSAVRTATTDLPLPLRPDAADRLPLSRRRPSKGNVALKDKSPDKKDAVQLEVRQGPERPARSTSASRSRAPTTAVCVYDSSAAPQPIALTHVPAGGTCGTKPCWKTIKGGFKYNDKLLTPDGIQQVQLSEGVAPRRRSW